MENLNKGDYKLTLNRPKNNMYLREFVKVPGEENIFFVVDFDLDDKLLTCIEVHENKPLAYGIRFYSINQVTPTKWNGPHLTMEEVEAVFNQDTHDCSNLLLTMPEAEEPNERG